MVQFVVSNWLPLAANSTPQIIIFLAAGGSEPLGKSPVIQR